MIDRRSAADDGPGRHVSRDPALRRNDRAIADLAVTHHSHLPGENHILAHVGRTGEADLRRQQRVFANARAVAHLHQIVDLYAAADVRLANAGAVDTGIGLHLHVIFEDDGFRLHDLVPVSGIVLGETEAVGSEDRAILQNHPVSQPAVLPHHGVRMSQKVVADFDSAINDHMGQKHSVGTDFDVLIDHHVGAEMGARSDLGGIMHNGRGMHPGLVVRQRPKQRDGTSKIQVGIFAAQHGRRNRRRIFCQQNGGSAGSLGGCRVLIVGNETELPGSRFLDAGNAGDLSFRRTIFQARTESSGKLCKFHKVVRWRRLRLIVMEAEEAVQARQLVGRADRERLAHSRSYHRPGAAALRFSRSAIFLTSVRGNGASKVAAGKKQRRRRRRDEAASTHLHSS